MRATIRYYVDGFPGAYWTILAWLRRPHQRWGWIIAGLLWPFTSNLWLLLQLKYGDDWYRTETW